LSIVEMGAWGVDSTGNMTQGSAISALKTGFKVIAFGNTTSNTVAPGLRASVTGVCGGDSGCVTINASNSTSTYSEINLDPASGIRMSHGLNPVGCLTFSSESASSPYKMVMASTTNRSLTLGTIDSSRGGLLWSKSVSYSAKDNGEIVVYGVDEDLTGKATYTETHSPWLQLNQTSAGMTSGKFELYYNYSDGRGNANYSTGLSVYLDRIERYQSTGTANWTANSLITQGYADTRYPRLDSPSGQRIFSQQVANNKNSQIDIGVTPGITSVSASHGLYMSVVPLDDEAYMAIEMTKSDVILDFENKTWSANSILTQSYADTRYAPIGGGGGITAAKSIAYSMIWGR